MRTFRSLLAEQMSKARAKHLPKDEDAVSSGEMVGLFVGMSLAIVVAAYLYLALLGPVIIDLTNASGTNYIGSGASPLVTAITVMYFLAVFILPVIVVMKLTKGE